MLWQNISKLYTLLLLLFLAVGTRGHARIKRQSGLFQDPGQGTCVKLSQCEPLFKKLMQKPVPSTVYEELRARACGYDGSEPKINCPSSTTPTTPPTPAPISELTDHPNFRLLPGIECGQSFADKVFGGKDALLGAYPWMASLGYRDKRNGNLKYACGGALINSRYVLTAAHCVTNLRFFELVKVRLGEHDTSKAVDCELNFCADPPQDFSIEDVIFHKDYNFPNDDNENDIALIRLDSEANYTYSVNSICLPFGTLKDSTYLDHPSQPTVAGWGRTETALGSEILQQVRIPIIPLEDCRKTYRLRSQVRNISSKQLCAGEVGKDSCGGDSGGPLMVTQQNPLPQYVIIGIVSFGPSACGHPEIPGVYTKVGSYLTWILDNLKS